MIFILDSNMPVPYYYQNWLNESNLLSRKKHFHLKSSNNLIHFWQLPSVSLQKWANRTFPRQNSTLSRWACSAQPSGLRGHWAHIGEQNMRERGLELAPGLSPCSKVTEWIRAYAASVMSLEGVWTPTVLLQQYRPHPPGFDSRASCRADLQSPTSTELHGTGVVGPQAVLRSVKHGGPGHWSTWLPVLQMLTSFSAEF